MRAYFVAVALTALVIGLPLLLAGAVRIGCTVSIQGGITTYSNCGGADALQLVGEVLVIAALALFGASCIPNDPSPRK